MRVLVVDDSVLFRRVLAEVLASFPGVEVVGTVANGRLALKRLPELRPEVITLDIEMPEMDGLAVLDALRERGEKIEILMVSALTKQGGQMTMRALEKGAFDFITKPDTANLEQSRLAVRRELEPRIRALARRLEVRRILRPRVEPPARIQGSAASLGAARAPAPDLDQVATRMSRLSAASGKPELVLVGVSTGGPAALASMMPQLPRDLGVPVVIVQHMPPIFTQSLAESLNSKCVIGVVEGAHGMALEANRAYIAPGGKQMRLASGPEGKTILQITDDPPENNCKPSVDYLFRSAASLLPGRSMAVIMTGMGNDGTIGLRLLKRHGCFVVAQDEASCVVYGMSKSAVEARVVDVVLPLSAIAARIVATVRNG